MRKAAVLLSGFLAFAGTLLAQVSVITLPAAASLVGGAPFLSDVRVFNTSYNEILTVVATYRCFLDTCPTIPAHKEFTLQPRESLAFDDMVASPSGFNAPNSAGGVEFSFPGASKQLVVTSRLFSTAPIPTVGMYIPGLRSSQAHSLTVLSSVRNAGPDAGFRTNVGVFNSGDAPAAVSFQIFDGGSPAGNPVTIPGGVGAHSGAQVNGIFGRAGVPTLATDNATIVVTASAPVFSYAAVIDNNTTDPIFVVGAPDQPVTPIATSPTATPPGLTPTRTGTPSVPTPTPSGPTPTPPPQSERVVAATSEGGTRFIDKISGDSTSTITLGTTVVWVSLDGIHSTTSGSCPPCTADGLWDSGEGFESFSRTFDQTGTFPYFCTVHGASMTGTVIVNP